DDWNTHATAVTDTGSIALVSGQQASIRLEYFDASDPASVQLAWSGAATPSQVIPAQQLLPATDSLLTKIDNAFAFAGQQINVTLADSNVNTSAFPFYTNPNGTWVTSDKGNWTAGFFAGEMWQLYQRTNDPVRMQQATTWTLPL